MKRKQSNDTCHHQVQAEKEEALWQRFQEQAGNRADRDDPPTIPLRTMIEFSLDQIENMPSQASSEKEYSEIDTAALKRRIFFALEQERRSRKKAKHSIKWISAAAASLAVVVLFGVSSDASLRAHVVDNIVKPNDRNTLFRYEVEGVPLTALPDGYGPHYIPERFVVEETLSDDSFMRLTLYETIDNKQSVSVTIQVLVNSSAMVGDNEHTTYRTLDFGDADAYLGIWEDDRGHSLHWVSEGMEHFIYGNVSEEEIMEIARNIY